MELKVSSQKSGLLSSDYTDDPEEKEISEGEDEDDDRNHKHRRREGRSQSMEMDSLDQGLTRPVRKRNRPFDSGYSARESDSQSGVAWNNYNANPERDFSSRHEKRRPNQASFSKAPSDWNQRMRGNLISGETAPPRGRGREPISWDIRDSRFGMVDAASQVVQPGYVPSGIFAGRGLQNVSNPPNLAWNGFGLFPGISNGIDAIHPLGLPGALGPAISPPMNIGMPRQRCPDFEERGFCLRGDMCPMEHGFNRIVVEDVQSLSQFNLPVSLSGSQLIGPPGQGALAVTSGAPGPLVNDVLGLNGSRLEASDVYDPDQPLWTNDNVGPSAAFNQSNTEAFINGNLSNRQNIESVEGFGDERVTSITSQGRVGSSKRRTGVKETVNSVGTSSTILERGTKNEDALNTDHIDAPDPRKWTNFAGNGSSFKPQNDSGRNIRKPSQKALRTLFVSGIPLKDNKRESLLSHFQKFGEVTNIRIPMQSERAFVQFSKSEEAEEALKAPDAVMGNRFIRLFWANRDNIPDDSISGGSSVPMTPHGITLNPGRSHPFVLDKRKEHPNPAGGKDGDVQASVGQELVVDHPKSTVASGLSPLPQKKLENLELLKEELRKKQDMLEQKRSEFRRQLDKLQRQASGSKDVTLSESPRTIKVEATPGHKKPETAESSPRDRITSASTTSSGQKVVPHASTSNLNAASQEPLRPIQSIPSAWAPIAANRFKLDNRPTAFKVGPPLPAGIVNVAALKEHFSAFGDLSSVELEESENHEHSDDSVESHVSARVCFTSRRSAEKAFLQGKTWQGHKMQFKWLTPGSAGKDGAGSGNASVVPKMTPSYQQSSESMSTQCVKTVALECGEPEHPVKKSDAEAIEQNRDLKSTSASSSCEKKLSSSS